MCIKGEFSTPSSETEEADGAIATDERDTMAFDRHGRNLRKIDDEWLERMKEMHRWAFPRQHAEEMKPKNKRANRKRNKQCKIKRYLRKTK